MKKIAILFTSLFLMSFIYAQEAESTAAPADEKKKEKKEKEAKEPKAPKTPKKSGDLDAANPQIQNKNSKDIMPVEGEFGVGINATSLVRNVLGHFGTSNFSGTATHYVSGGVYGKYMLTNSTAVRVGFNFRQASSNDQIKVKDDSGQDPDSVTFDEVKFRDNDYDLTVGYEMRRGKGRFRAAYGGALGFSLSTDRTNYEYGNAMGASNSKPTTYTTSVYRNGNERLIRTEGFGDMTLSLRGFLGIEYFFMPKVCIGTEFGLGVSSSWDRDRVNLYEYYDPSSGEIATKEDKENTNYGRWDFNLSTDNFNSSLYLMIYF